jgi:Zn-dependent protease with chaperone function/uncharacterized tellurite resistance protein B-like protein
LLQKAAAISGVVALLLLVSFSGFSRWAGQSRRKITVIFPPLVAISILLLSGLILVQGAVLTYGAYLAESYALGQVHFVLIGAIALGSAAAGLGLISSIFKMTRKRTSAVLGLPLDLERHPNTFSYVSELATRLGAKAPDNIVVGLEPTFYVTSADIQVLGTDTMLKGESLFLSMPLSRIMTREELTGIIGHELGHFRGDDTAYSMKFAPVYAGLGHAVNKMASGSDGSRHGIAAIPAQKLLMYMLETFHKNVSAVSRIREFEADKAGSEVAPGRALATSLLKVSLYARSWNNIQHQIVERMQQRKFTRNMSLLFSGIVQYDIDMEKLPEIVKAIGEESISHPTDSHPPTSIRIQELGLDISEVRSEELMSPRDSAIELIDDYQAIEEHLTRMQQQYYSAMGVEVPEEEQGSTAAFVLGAFGAHIVLADGDVAIEEIERAEAIGFHLTEHFDVIEFREFCLHPEDLPDIDKLIEYATGYDAEPRALILEYMTKIADADNDICEAEQSLLAKVKSGFEL